MEHLIRLDQALTRADLCGLFSLAEAYEAGHGPERHGCSVLFFPASSLRTRVTFELGAARMGLRPVTFPPDTLDKPEAHEDVAAYLAQWADIMIVRHPDISVLDRLAAANTLPVVNAMTDENHPCEVLSDLFALSRTSDPFGLRYLFVGADGNIARAWQEAASAFNLELIQCCPAGLASPGAEWTDDLITSVGTADVIITDGPGPHADERRSFQITAEVLSHAPNGVRLVPCPPFMRGREVSAKAIDHPAFVGHEFKSALLPMQQAVMATLLGLA